MEKIDFEKIETIANKNGFNAVEDNEGVEFSVIVTKDGDFDFFVWGNDLKTITNAVGEYAVNFDIDSETYLWLDGEGHGTNGAPYHMIDVLKTMTKRAVKIIRLAFGLYKEAYGKDNWYSFEYLTLAATKMNNDLHYFYMPRTDEGFMNIIDDAMTLLKTVDFSNVNKTYDSKVISLITVSEYGLTAELDNGRDLHLWELSLDALKQLAETLIDELFARAKKAKSCNEIED